MGIGLSHARGNNPQVKVIRPLDLSTVPRPDVQPGSPALARGLARDVLWGCSGLNGSSLQPVMVSESRFWHISILLAVFKSRLSVKGVAEAVGK